MFVVRSFCLGADSAFADNALADLQNTDGHANLVVLGLVKRGQATVFALLPQVAQKLFVFELVLEAQLFAHSLVFWEQKLVSGNVFVPLLKSELESSEVDNSFFPEFFKVFDVLLRWCCACSFLIAFLALFVPVELLNQLVVVFDLQPQQSFFLGLKHLVGLSVIEKLLVNDKLQIFSLVLLDGVFFLFAEDVRTHILERTTMTEDIFHQINVFCRIFSC